MAPGVAVPPPIAPAVPVKGVKEILDEGGVTSVPNKFIRPAHERPQLGEVATDEHIPVIDISALVSQSESSKSTRAEVIRQIGDACEEWGFFQVVNHGVDVEDMMGGVKRFYELPAAEKKAQVPPGGEASGVVLTTGFNEQEGAAQDWKDGLVIRRRPGICDGFPLTPQAMREEALQYLASIESLGRVIYEAMFESLGLSQEYVKGEGALPEIDRVTMIANFYPPCPDPSLVLALRPHADVGTVTLLLPDQVPGLQVRKGDTWVAIDPLPSALIVNVANQVEILSNGKFKSMEHRVIANQGCARVSVVTFFAPREETIIAPLPALCNEHSPPIFRPVAYGEFLQNYLTTNISHYKLTTSTDQEECNNQTAT